MPSTSGVVAWPRADFTEGAGDPLRLCQEGKRKLTESAKEFPKVSAWQSPEGSLREVRERMAMPRRPPPTTYSSPSVGRCRPGSDPHRHHQSAPPPARTYTRSPKGLGRPLARGCGDGST